MSDETKRGFNPQVPTVTGFFGAITFATMILLMQFPESIKYSEYLIPFTALISFFFIITTVGGSLHDSIAESMSQSYKRLILISFLIGYYGLIVLIPSLVYSFNEIGAYVLLGIFVIVIIIFNRLIPKAGVKF